MDRQEDGEGVVVQFERTERLTKSSADMLVGLRDLREVTKNGKVETSVFDPDNKYYIFIRWDRVYVERNVEGQKTGGYWHINAHRPELTLLPHDEVEKKRKLEYQGRCRGAENGRPFGSKQGNGDRLNTPASISKIVVFTVKDKS